MKKQTQRDPATSGGGAFLRKIEAAALPGILTRLLRKKENAEPVNATIVIDPGHGGDADTGGSGANHAVSCSGVLEKNMTLQLGLLLRDALETAATEGGHQIKIVLTRETDVNLSLADRAGVAKDNRADRFLSLHFNGCNKVMRGTETYIRSRADNVNLAADKKFARRIQRAAFGALKKHDRTSRDRKVREGKLGVLSDVSLGNTDGDKKCRACLLELDFIDVEAVDQLLNVNPNAAAVRADVAKALAEAIIADLQNP
ncbi:MAG TPA: N-acetylmuramoyl-L-alanine amidase [Pyrinomonadaceae bacterium]|nr:N-acetylmuramoyl-L-alanine amidase [Pyrinomonadaceae bacterium]